MAPVVPSTVPTEFESGSTVHFTQQPADFPVAESWTLKLAVSGAGQKIVTATVVDDTYDFALDAADNDLQPGTYKWSLYAEKASPAERHVIDSGTLAIKAAPADAAAGDLISQDEQELAVLNAAIKARLTSGGDVQSYTIGDRSLDKIPITDLIAWRNQLRARVSARRRGSPFRAVKTRFTGVTGG